MTKDDRVSSRCEKELKDWIALKGGSKFLCKLVRLAYFKLEGKEFETEEKIDF